MTTMQFIGGIIIAIITGLATIYGQRLLSKSSQQAQLAQTEVEQRKVDQAAFDKFVHQYEREHARLVHQLDQTTAWLETAASWIRRTHDVGMQNGWLLPRVPEEIRRLPMYLYKNETEE